MNKTNETLVKIADVIRQSVEKTGCVLRAAFRQQQWDFIEYEPSCGECYRRSTWESVNDGDFLRPDNCLTWEQWIDFVCQALAEVEDESKGCDYDLEQISLHLGCVAAEACQAAYVSALKAEEEETEKRTSEIMQKVDAVKNAAGWVGEWDDWRKTSKYVTLYGSEEHRDVEDGGVEVRVSDHNTRRCVDFDLLTFETDEETEKKLESLREELAKPISLPIDEIGEMAHTIIRG